MYIHVQYIQYIQQNQCTDDGIHDNCGKWEMLTFHSIAKEAEHCSLHCKHFKVKTANVHYPIA